MCLAHWEKFYVASAMLFQQLGSVLYIEVYIESDQDIFRGEQGFSSYIGGGGNFDRLFFPQSACSCIQLGTSDFFQLGCESWALLVL